MKKVAILPNIQKDKGLAVTKRLVRYLEEKGCQPRLSEAVADLADCRSSAIRIFWWGRILRMMRRFTGCPLIWR